MHRFAETAKPNKESIGDSICEIDDWAIYQLARQEMDAIMSNWSMQLDTTTWLAGDLILVVALQKCLLIRPVVLGDDYTST